MNVELSKEFSASADLARSCLNFIFFTGEFHVFLFRYNQNLPFLTLMYFFL